MRDVATVAVAFIATAPMWPEKNCIGLLRHIALLRAVDAGRKTATDNRRHDRQVSGKCATK